MPISVAQTLAINSTAALEDASAAGTFATNVAAGSLLVVVGVGVQDGTFLGTQLSSVTDNRGNTWTTPVNFNGGDAYSPTVWFAYAMNAAAGSTTVTVNLSTSSSNRLSALVFEVTGAATTGALDSYVTGSDATTGSVVSTSATATLAQANNLVVLIGGGYMGTPSTTSGYTAHATNSNGTNNQTGFIAMTKVTAATTAQTGSVAHTSVTARRQAMLMVFKEAAGGGTSRRYKFQFDSGTFTSADTGITGYVWRNGDPDQLVAEKYTSLSGDATAGTLLITSASGVPQTAAVTDTIKGVFYNGSDTSGLVTGTVESV